MADAAKTHRLANIAMTFCWLYLAGLIGLISFLRTQGDRSSFATVVLFAPRWIFAVPLALLLPAVVYRRCWIPLGISLVVALFPLMGFCVGFHRWASAGNGPTLRVVTFNLHQIPLDAPGFKEYLGGVKADVLVFEEIPDRINRRDLPEGLSHTARHGQMLVASRYPLHVTKILQQEIAIRYTVDAPAGKIDLIGVHLASPHWALRDSLEGTGNAPEELRRNIANRRDEAELLAKEIHQSTDHPLIIAGDFNLAPHSPLFTGNFSDMTDAFESAGLGFGWTYYHQHAMVRIDHVLCNASVECNRCTVGPNLGSPHRPLFAELTFNPATAR